LLAAVAILRPWIQPYPASQVTLNLTNSPPFTSRFILGGDQAGRDILSRLIASTTGAFESAALLLLVAGSLGVIGGMAAGYFAGKVDAISSWIFSVFMAVPAVVILISLYALLGVSTSGAMVVFGVLLAPQMYWVVRTVTRDVRQQLYIDAAKVSGLSDYRIIRRHVLAAIRAPMILMAAGLAAAGIGVQAGLQFLGLGDATVPTLGGMLSDAFNNIYAYPIQLLWPAALLALITGAFTLISVGLRDALEGTHAKPTRGQLDRAQVVVLPAASSPRAMVEQAPAVHLMTVERLRLGYLHGNEVHEVVRDVSVHVETGEILGIVGESGSGKSQTVFAMLGLLPEAALVLGGSIRLEGAELVGRSPKEWQRLRRSEVAYVPQEPTSNLDPTYSVGAQLVEGIRAQLGLSRSEAEALALSLLERVGIGDPNRVMSSYPHQISGGMAQRVLIAGAVANRPKLLIADEPTTALDVTIQAEVLDLIRDLQRERGMAVIIVTHNFGVVADLCDRVVVMRNGRIVESGAVQDVFYHPENEHTKALLAAVLDDAPLREPKLATRGSAGVRVA